MQGYAPILRLERIDEERDKDPFVLLRASQDGPKALDLKILATESRAEYAGNLKHSQIKTLRAKNYEGSDEEWDNILRRTFDPYISSRTNKQSSKPLEHECVVNVTEGRELTLIWRKKSSGIIQRLGSLTLQPAQVEGEIDLFEWCVAATQRLTQSSNDVLDLRGNLKTTQARVEDLDRQLAELTKAKIESEAELISRFCDLINAKKLKIRDQQRLLASAQPDASLVENLRESEERTDSRQKSRPSRQTKRKATRSLKVESDSDDGFEPIRRNDMNMQDDEDEVAQQETPEPSDVSTDSDDLDVSSSMTRPPNLASQSQSQLQATKNSATQQSQTATPEANLSPKLPIRRQLPFAKPAATESKPQQSQGGNDATMADPETESDDEL